MSMQTWLRYFMVLGATLCSPLYAKPLDVDGSWKGAATCPEGPVAFELTITGAEGAFTYENDSPKAASSESTP